jgi:hypothetical protein
VDEGEEEGGLRKMRRMKAELARSGRKWEEAGNQLEA